MSRPRRDHAASSRPEARVLARRIMEHRRNAWAPLRGLVRSGWKLAALAHGHGVDGQYMETTGGSRGAKVPRGVHGQAGWLVWLGEGWDMTKRAR